jgi:hypothetical protein
MLGDLVYLVGCVSTDDDAEPDTAATDLGIGVAIGGKLVDGEQGEQRAAQLEDSAKRWDRERWSGQGTE